MTRATIKSAQRKGGSFYDGFSDDCSSVYLHGNDEAFYGLVRPADRYRHSQA